MLASPEERQKLAWGVLEVVTVKGPIKAQAIRDQLPKKLLAGTDKTDINSVLYNELKAEVEKDPNTHEWSRVGATRADPAPASPQPRREAPRETPRESVGTFQATEEQKRAIDFEIDGHLLVRGEAGSGKTTVLAARAGRIKAQCSSGTLLFLTYNSALAAYVRVLLERAGASEGVEVLTYHAWAKSFAERHGFPIQDWLNQRDRKEHLVAAVSGVRGDVGSHRLLGLPVDWWGDEFAWIFGQGLADPDDYSSAARTGRGKSVQVRGDDRRIVWAVLEKYLEALRARGLWDMDDPGGLVFRSVASHDFKFEASSRRDHVLVDEVQDFDKSWLMALMPIPSSTLTLAGDLAQRIYRRSFSWKEVGINVTGGRSKTLKGSLRTTKQIMLVAKEVATNTDVKQHDDYVYPSIPERNGPPVVRFVRQSYHAAESDALAWLATEVKTRPQESFAIGAPFRNMVSEVGEVLKKRGLRVEVSRGEALAKEKKGVVAVTTYHQLKGLEYDNVLLLGLDDAIMPGWYLKQIDEEDRDEAEPYHRRLVYVAMTRARRQLALAGAPKFCRFFDSVPASLFQDE